MARIHEGALEAISDRPDIIGMLSAFTNDFDVTWARKMRLHGADVVALLLRPEKHIRSGFGLDQEILLLYHQYSSIQPRILHIAEQILSESPCVGRAEPLAFMLLTAAMNAKEQIRRLSVDSNNPRVVIPFEESECKKVVDPYFVRNRLIEFFYSRDLFEMSRPLSSDLYFFGRHAFVLSLRDLLKNGENIGLFGLRRTGKTSVLLRLQRIFETEDSGRLYYLDLEDSALYQMRWWELLERIGRSLANDKNKAPYSELDAASRFRGAVNTLSKAKKTIIALDEIEHVTPGERLRMRSHWDGDFVEFWKTVRAIQNENRHVSFIVCGTNATPVETASFQHRDNPLFGMVTIRYMPSFSRDEIRQMTRTLGRFMGLDFQENAFDYLRDRFGGHPYITRQACSRVFAETSTLPRPVSVTASSLAGGEAVRELSLFSHAENVLSVLQRWYPLEHEMLEYLAGGELGNFQDIEQSMPDLSAHLRAYGLVNGTPPSISMQFISSFLRHRVLVQRNEQPIAEVMKVPAEETNELLQRLQAVGFHRNRVEIKLRKFVKRVLVSTKGPQRWIDVVLAALPTERREKLNGVDRDEILNSNLFLLDIVQTVLKNWTLFAHLEQQPVQSRVTKVQFETLGDFLNKHREDAHAKDVDDTTVASVALAAKSIESAIDPYLSD